MAKARWLKPEFFTDPKVSAVSDQAALVFQALWVEADDGGVAPGDSRIIFGRRFITRTGWTPTVVEAGLRELAEAGLIVRFSTKGQDWAYIPKLMENQCTKPKDWRHLGKQHAHTLKQVLADASVTDPVLSRSNGDLTSSNREPTASGADNQRIINITPKQLAVAEAEAVAVPEAGAVPEAEAEAGRDARASGGKTPPTKLRQTMDAMGVKP